ncbi:MAG: HK97 family phage prohead protease [Actinobacteria bacterium]|nr:HK97 family phage prohead protease [Actinomycetota bacterium]
MTKSFAYAEVKALATDSPTGEFEAILSTSALDRDGEIVDAGAFNPLPSRISIDVDHGLSTASTVGSGTPFYDGDLLKIKGTFSSIPRAQEVRQLVTEGHINAMSVAFIDAKRTKATKDEPRHVTKADLLNAAFVPIPANRQALVLSAKAGARNSAADQKMIQTMHDTTVGLGADCGTGKSAAAPTTKAISGSYEDLRDNLVDAIVDASAGELASLYPSADPGEYEWRVDIVGTFADRVVYALGEDVTYQAPYTVGAGGEVTLGTPTPVEVDQVVVPADPEDQAAAGKAAARSPADADTAMLIRALRLVEQSVA